MFKGTCKTNGKLTGSWLPIIFTVKSTDINCRADFCLPITLGGIVLQCYGSFFSTQCVHFKIIEPTDLFVGTASAVPELPDKWEIEHGLCACTER